MRKFGLIGFPLGHSFSKVFFERKFAELGATNCCYDNYEIENLVQLPEGLSGFSVTIPHKRSVMALLKSIDPVAEVVGAVNCVDVDLRGYNTDIVGFEKGVLALIGEDRPNALVLGTGGVSKAVEYVLTKLGMEYRVVSRSGGLTYENLSAKMVEESKLLINTTPLGMFPDVAKMPDLPYDVIGCGHFLYDLVYNPAETRFMQQGRIRGAWVSNGIMMLHEQAEEAWRIWNERF